MLTELSGASTHSSQNLLKAHILYHEE